MHRWLIVLSTFLVAAASVTAAGIAAPHARAGDAPIGHIGDTLRVDTGTHVADVTISSVTPFADAYKPRTSDAPDALDNMIVNAPQGSIVRGEVYWDAHRDPVSNVVLLDKKTSQHLAQWNL
jgi:hypothetical protein